MITYLVLPHHIATKEAFDEFLRGQNVVLASNRDLPIGTWHDLVYNLRGCVLEFIPKVTVADGLGVKKDPQGDPVFVDGLPLLCRFFYGMCAPICFGSETLPAGQKILVKSLALARAA